MYMDIVFMVGLALLWGVTALLVMGFELLDQPTKGQP
jgi:hypothetical protein